MTSQIFRPFDIIDELLTGVLEKPREGGQDGDKKVTVRDITRESDPLFRTFPESSEVQKVLTLPSKLFFPFKKGVDTALRPTGSIFWEILPSIDSNWVSFYEPFPAVRAKIAYCLAFCEVILNFSSKKTELVHLEFDKYLSQLSGFYALPYLKYTKVIKYQYAYPMAVIMRRSECLLIKSKILSGELDNPNGWYDAPLMEYHYITKLPPLPSFCKEGVGLSGPFRRAYRNRMVSHQCARFAWEIAQGVKRALPTPDKSLAFASLINHAVALGTPPTFDFKSEGLVVESIIAFVDEVFGSKPRFDYDFDLANTELSQSASIDRNRRFGGTREDFVLKHLEHSTKNWFSQEAASVNGRKQMFHAMGPYDPSMLHSVSQEGKSNLGHSHLSIRDIYRDLDPVTAPVFKGVTFKPDRDYIVEIPRDSYTRVPFYKTVSGFTKAYVRDLISKCTFTPSKKPEALAIALPEPNKFRIITEQESDGNVLGKPVQKGMWRALRCYKPFVLIGEPLDPSHFSQIDDFSVFQTDEFTDLLGGLSFNDDLFPKMDLIVSGDYSAATDGLDPESIKILFSRILLHLSLSKSEVLTGPIIKIIQENLYGLSIRYPKDLNEWMSSEYEHYLEKGSCDPLLTHFFSFNNPDEPLACFWLPNTGVCFRPGDPENFLWVEQVTGQFMGSIVSFPTLCMLNYLCWLDSLVSYFTIKAFRKPIPDYYRDISDYFIRNINLSPVLINGDDISFRTNADHYEFWLRSLKKFGFTPSQGKNFVSPDFVTLNSELFLVDRLSPIRRYIRQPYCNLGLLHKIGQNVAVRASSLPHMPLSDFYELSVNTSANPERTHDRFIHNHLETIKSMTDGGYFNLFMSPLLGGFGFKTVNRKIKYTDSQLQLADAYRRHWRDLKDTFLQDLSSVEKQTIHFSMDDKDVINPFVTNSNAGFISFLKPYDVPNRDLKPLGRPIMPPLFQPGNWSKFERNRMGHYVKPPRKWIENLRKKGSIRRSDKLSLMNFNLKFFQSNSEFVRRPPSVKKLGIALPIDYDFIANSESHFIASSNQIYSTSDLLV